MAKPTHIPIPEESAFDEFIQSAELEKILRDRFLRNGFDSDLIADLTTLWDRCLDQEVEQDHAFNNGAYKYDDIPF